MTRLALIVCSFGYLGYIPFAPGTIGSAAGLLVLWLLRANGSGVIAEMAAIAGLFVVGAWSGTRAEAHFGTIDPGQAIIDEVMGMLITVLLIPVSLTGAIAGFVLFRIFDVIKPYPASRFERLAGGTGMMADDAMAAVYANLSLRALMWIAPKWIA